MIEYSQLWVSKLAWELYRECRFCAIRAVVGVSRLKDSVQCFFGSISHFLIEHVSFERIWIPLVMSQLSVCSEGFLNETVICVQSKTCCLPYLLSLLANCTSVL